MMNRRELLASMGFLAPLRALAAVAKPVRIKAIETFDIVIPVEGAAATLAAAPGPFNAASNRFNVTRIETDSGVRGYSFGGSRPDDVKAANEILIGQDLFALEQHLKKGLISWTAVEEAMWDGSLEQKHRVCRCTSPTFGPVTRLRITSHSRNRRPRRSDSRMPVSRP